MKKIIIIIIIILFIGGCGKVLEKGISVTPNGTIEGIEFKESDTITNYVKIEMESGKYFIIELDPQNAPITVSNFQKLVNNKFYDDLIFHRVIKNFMIQGGDPTGTGYGGSSEKIKGEFEANGVNNNLKHGKGIVSMARSKDMDSASSQFFICTDDNISVSYLDGNYAAFGKVIAGFDVVLEISEVKTNDQDKPYKNQVMHTVRFVDIIKE